MQADPRTVARDIPGIFDEMFPQLTPGIVAHFNSHADVVKVESIAPATLLASKLQRAMLFELGFSAGEALIEHGAIDWENCLKTAVDRWTKPLSR